MGTSELIRIGLNLSIYEKKKNHNSTIIMQNVDPYILLIIYFAFNILFNNKNVFLPLIYYLIIVNLHN